MLLLKKKKKLDSNKYFFTPVKRQIDGFLSNEICGVYHHNERYEGPVAIVCISASSRRTLGLQDNVEEVWQLEKGKKNQTRVVLVWVKMEIFQLGCGYCFNMLLMFHVSLFKKLLDFSEFYMLPYRCIFPFWRGTPCGYRAASQLQWGSKKLP